MKFFQKEKRILIQNKTILIAHRGYTDTQTGYPSRVPENTVPAFEHALQEGFGGVECDIWETGGRESDLMVLHDESLERMCGVKSLITELSPAEIRSYPMGKKPDFAVFLQRQALRLLPNSCKKRFQSDKNARYFGKKPCVPFFREYLQVMAKRKDAVLVIEIKSRKPMSEEHAITDRAAQQLTKELYQICPGHKTVIQSFNLHSLMKIKPLLRADTELFYLSKKKKDLTPENLQKYQKMGIGGVSIKHTTAMPEILKGIKACGLKTAVWTVDDQAMAWSLAQTHQVEYIISNKKVLMKRIR